MIGYELGWMNMKQGYPFTHRLIGWLYVGDHARTAMAGQYCAFDHSGGCNQTVLKWIVLHTLMRHVLTIYATKHKLR